MRRATILVYVTPCLLRHFRFGPLLNGFICFKCSESEFAFFPVLDQGSSRFTTCLYRVPLVFLVGKSFGSLVFDSRVQQNTLTENLDFLLEISV